MEKIKFLEGIKATFFFPFDITDLMSHVLSLGVCAVFRLANICSGLLRVFECFDQWTIKSNNLFPINSQMINSVIRSQRENRCFVRLD